MSVERPRKQTAMGLYSKRYYNEKVKNAVDLAWKKIKDMAAAGTRIQLCNEYIREAWEKETPSFREALEKETEDTFNKEMAAYKSGKGWQPRSAEEYAQSVLNVRRCHSIDLTLSYQGDAGCGTDSNPLRRRDFPAVWCIRLHHVMWSHE